MNDKVNVVIRFIDTDHAVTHSNVTIKEALDIINDATSLEKDRAVIDTVEIVFS